MGLFGFFKKKNQKEESEMTEDEKQEAKAKEDIAEKGPDSQTEKDRIDESVAAQERADGNEDSQSAKDRVDESEGAKRADEERAEEKKEGAEATDAAPAWAGEILAAVKGIAEMLQKQAEAQAEKESAPDTAAAERMEAAFGVGNGAFPAEHKEEEAKKITPAEVAATLRNLGM